MYTIGVFAKKVNLSIDTLRYYEKETLILPKRDEINRRMYDDVDIAWILFIKKLKKTGMSIKNIKEYAILRYQGEQTLENRMDLLDQQYEMLVAQKREIEEHMKFLKEKITIYQDMMLKREE